jgi:carbonic anhydrase
VSGIDELLAANKLYAAQFDKCDLPAPPAKHVAVLTCMDARMHLNEILGLEVGDAHIIRNAGGRATDDAIRSLIISIWLLGVDEIMVIHHTRCGLHSRGNAEIRQLLREQTGHDPSGIDFLAFSDLEQSVRQDVRRLKESPFISWQITIRGFIYDVKTGELLPVVY